MNPKSVLYIKLGGGGAYEEKCLTSPGYLWVGWHAIAHDLCVKGDWEAVAMQGRKFYHSDSTATNQSHQLRNFYKSGDDVLWITFYNDHLFWCFADTEIILQEDNSRIRKTKIGWYHTDINGNDLDTSRLSGSLLATKGFRGTICSVKESEYVIRKINDETSPIEEKAIVARNSLINSLVEIIQTLHWKEFELLTDLIFRQAGWQRLDVLGKTTKDIDLNMLSPINQERYKVQVKSSAGKKEFQDFLKYAEQNEEFAQYYFIVHTPDASLTQVPDNQSVKLWFPLDIAQQVVNYGLVDWLIAKAK